MKFGEKGVYDPSNWPGARFSAALAYDQATNRVLLISGTGLAENGAESK